MYVFAKILYQNEFQKNIIVKNIRISVVKDVSATREISKPDKMNYPAYEPN